MKSSTLKRITLGILLLIIGGIGGYLLATHQFHKKATEKNFPLRPYMDSMFYDPFGDFEHREKRMENMFNDLEKEFYKEEKDIFNNWSDIKDLKYLSGDSNSDGSFHYFKRLNNNGKESSYNVNGKWNDGEKGGTITVTGTNIKGKKFSYSGTIHDGKFEGKLIDEDGNSKNMNLKQIDLKEIYDNSNSLSE